jgi:hypothetical protein
VEADFQRELLKRVAMAPKLGGRVQKHAWQGGGPADLIHEGVVAELKFEKKTPVTVESAKDYALRRPSTRRRGSGSSRFST